MRIWLLAVLVACGDDQEPGGLDAAMHDATSDTAVDAPRNDSYAAFAIIGGIDRLSITKAAGPTCFVVVLANTGGPETELSIPPSWVVERVEARQPAAACNPGFAGPIANRYEATGRSGTIAWTANGIPQTIATLQVTLTFANHPAWCPPTEPLTASNLPVQ